MNNQLEKRTTNFSAKLTENSYTNMPPVIHKSALDKNHANLSKG